MYKVPVFAVAASVLLIVAAFSLTVGASVLVGVDEGDWIEYEVDVLLTENAATDISISSDHNITWAKMEITQVQGAQVSLSIQTKYSNGTITPSNITLNLEAGELGDDFIIPANLDMGRSFYDKHQGNITITNVGQSAVAGAQRTVISAATAETSYSWDQTTGILLSAQTTLAGYTVTTTAYKTNIWASLAVTTSPESTPHSNPQIPALNPTPIYALIVMVIIVLIIVGLVIILDRRAVKSGKP